MPILSDQTGLVEPLLRGDVYQVDLNPVRGSELDKIRPAVIIQNDTGNRFSPVTIIAPISSVKEITRPLPVMVFLKAQEAGLAAESYIDCGQIRTVDKTRLVNKLGHLSGQNMQRVDRAIAVSLDLQINVT